MLRTQEDLTEGGSFLSLGEFLELTPLNFNL